jgi:hypothetical protein
MGASSGIFGRSEVAMMVAVVLLTTLLTPVALRGAFRLRSPQDVAERLATAQARSRDPVAAHCNSAAVL